MANKNVLTQDEYIRLNEIIFFQLITKFFNASLSPVKIFQWIEYTCILGDVNKVALNSVVSSILNGDREFAYTQLEHMAILNKSGLPVRKICEKLNMSNTTYYHRLEEAQELVIKPRGTQPQQESIIAFLDIVDVLVAEERSF